MNCPSCHTPNTEGNVYCDHCGNPLTSAQPSQKRQTEAEQFVPPAGGKRRTEISDDPFAPFPSGAPMVGGFQPHVRGGQSPAPPPAPSQKRRTVFDSGGDDGGSGPVNFDGREGFAPSAGAAPKVLIGRRVVGWMVTFDNSPDGSSFVLREGRNAIGRSADCEVALPEDAMVSGSQPHAFVIWRSGRARIGDNNSQNGTFLNDEDFIGQVEVKDGDVVRVGRTRLIVRLLDPEKVNALWKPAGV